MGTRVRQAVANVKHPGRVDWKATPKTIIFVTRTSPQLCHWGPIDRLASRSALVTVRHPFGKELDSGLRPGTATSWRWGRHDWPAYSTNSIVDSQGVCFHVVIVCRLNAFVMARISCSVKSGRMSA